MRCVFKAIWVFFVCVCLWLATSSVWAQEKIAYDEEHVEHFLANAVNDVMRFDHSDYMESFRREATFFTIDGWKSYVNAMRDSDFLRYIINNKASTHLERSGTITVARSRGPVSDSTWVGEVPVIRKITNCDDAVRECFSLKVEVIPIEGRNRYGLGIRQWVMRENGRKYVNGECL